MGNNQQRLSGIAADWDGGPPSPSSFVRVEARGTVEALTVEHDRNPVVCFMFIKHDFN